MEEVVDDSGDDASSVASEESFRSDVSDEDVYVSDDDDDQFVRRRIEPKEGEGVPFTRAHLRNHPNNERAAAAMNRVIDANIETVDKLDTMKEVYTPRSSQEDNLNTDENCMEDEKGLSIYVVPTIDDRDEFKGGKSSSPDQRWKNSLQESNIYIAEEAQIAIPFDRLGKDAMTCAVDDSFKTIAKIEGVRVKERDIANLTVEKAIAWEDEGLSPPVRLVKESNEKFGGGRELGGMARALASNNLEGGYNGLLSSKYGLRIREGTNPNEHLQCSGVRHWVQPTMDDAVSSARTLVQKVVELHGERGRQFILKGDPEIGMTSSWEPDIPRPESSATHLENDALLNKQKSKAAKRWHDIFGKSPKKGAKKTPYNPKKGFNKRDRANARKVQRRDIVNLKIRGGVRLFDVASEAHRGEDSSIFLFLEEEGYGSEPIHSYLDTEAYLTDYNGKLSLAIVFNPLCDIFHSSEDTYTINWRQFVRQAKKAGSAHYLQALVWKLQKPSEDLSVKGNLSYWQNFPVAFLTRAVAFWNWHMHPFAATKVGETPLDKWRNMLSKEHHGLAASKYGVNKRQQRAEREREKRITDTKRDYEVHRYIVNCIAHVRSDAEDLDRCIEDAAHTIVHRNPSVNGAEGKRPKEKRDRLLETLKQKFLDEDDTTLHPRIEEKLVAVDKQEDDQTRQAQEERVAAPTGRVAKRARDHQGAWDKYL